LLTGSWQRVGALPAASTRRYRASWRCLALFLTHFVIFCHVLSGYFLSRFVWLFLSRFVRYLYSAFFAVMIVHRTLRDEHRCSQKYGDDWIEYKRRVPYVYFPGII
jgi:protein-S-isoprenylcysteine O-methyltransferase Ste14